MKFHDFYLLIVKNDMEAFTLPINSFLPFLTRNNLINPFWANQKNIDESVRVITNFCKNSSDEESIYNKLMKTGLFTEAECVSDTMLMLFAGFDTTSHGLASTLYFLKRNPDKLNKLVDELDKSKITKIQNQPSGLHFNIYQSCDYLTYVNKEALRIDSPTSASLGYKVIEDCKICGVDIPKDEILFLNLIYPHFMPDQWHKPLEFIPERFDPESEYFYKPGTNKEMRHPKAFIPFTFGMRNCAGQTLAKLEAKIILSKILSRIEFDINPQILNNPHAKFNIIAGEKLLATVTKIVPL